MQKDKAQQIDKITIDLWPNKLSRRAKIKKYVRQLLSFGFLKRVQCFSLELQKNFQRKKPKSSKRSNEKHFFKEGLSTKNTKKLENI